MGGKKPANERALLSPAIASPPFFRYYSLLLFFSLFLFSFLKCCETLKAFCNLAKHLVQCIFSLPA